MASIVRASSQVIITAPKARAVCTPHAVNAMKGNECVCSTRHPPGVSLENLPPCGQGSPGAMATGTAGFPGRRSGCFPGLSAGVAPTPARPGREELVCPRKRLPCRGGCFSSSNCKLVFIQEPKGKEGNKHVRDSGRSFKECWDRTFWRCYFSDFFPKGSKDDDTIFQTLKKNLHIH